MNRPVTPFVLTMTLLSIVAVSAKKPASKDKSNKAISSAS